MDKSYVEVNAKKASFDSAHVAFAVALVLRDLSPFLTATSDKASSESYTALIKEIYIRQVQYQDYYIFYFDWIRSIIVEIPGELIKLANGVSKDSSLVTSRNLTHCLEVFMYILIVVTGRRLKTSNCKGLRADEIGEALKVLKQVDGLLTVSGDKMILKVIEYQLSSVIVE